MLAPAQLRMAKLALSMHLTSPTVRMFDEIATQSGAKGVLCDTYVHIASMKICDKDALHDVLKAHKQYDTVSYIFGLFICFTIVLYCSVLYVSVRRRKIILYSLFYVHF